MVISRGFVFLHGEPAGFIDLLSKVSWMDAVPGDFYIPQLQVT